MGGPGTRLQPLTFTLPKPIVPVVNHPFLEHTIMHLKQFGVTEVILAMSYLPEKIREYFGDGERLGVRLIYCVEKDPLGTAGAVKNAAAYLDTPFIVLNGDDVFLEMDYHEVYRMHQEKNAKATIFLTRVENPSAFGVVETDKNGWVLRFIEKPPPGTETTKWINAGGYLLEPEVLEYIPENQHYMFEKGLFPALLEAGEPVLSYRYRGYWIDMGTLSNYFRLNMDILGKKAGTPLMKVAGRDGVSFGPNVIVHRSAEITAPAVIGRDCCFGKDARIRGPVVIGHDCLIEDGVRLENAILWDNVRVGAGARLNNCIISSRAVIVGGQGVCNCVITSEQSVPLPLQR